MSDMSCTYMLLFVCVFVYYIFPISKGGFQVIADLKGWDIRRIGLYLLLGLVFSTVAAFRKF